VVEELVAELLRVCADIEAELSEDGQPYIIRPDNEVKVLLEIA
jgi:hypothetical protein